MTIDSYLALRAVHVGFYMKLDVQIRKLSFSRTEVATENTK